MTTPSVLTPTAGEVLAAGIVWAIICTIVVALRFVARIHQKLSLLADDWLTVPALIGTLGMCATTIYGSATKALGYETPEAPLGQDPLTFQNSPISTLRIIERIVALLQCIGLTCTKLSCLFFYRRIFYTGQNRGFQITTLALMIITGLWGVAFFIAYLTECAGYSSAWWADIQTLSAYCGAAINLETSFAASDTAVDVALFIIPILEVMKLRMSRGRKIAVGVVFCLGGLAAAVSLIRLVVLVEVIQEFKSACVDSRAADSLDTSLVYWATIESGLALTAICLPSIYSVSKEAFKRVFVIPATSRKRSISIFSKKSGAGPQHRLWPLSRPNTTEETYAMTRGSRSRDIDTENWSLQDDAPAILDMPPVAHIESHARAPPLELHLLSSDERLGSHAAPPMGQIVVESQIEQTEHIV